MFLLPPLSNSDACSNNEGMFLVGIVKKMERLDVRKKRRKITRNVTYLL